MTIAARGRRPAAVRALKRRGDDALAIVKSTEVMIARALPADPTRKR